MTPKEKANELVEKYDSTLTYLESKAKAKQCALIAVNEVLDDDVYDMSEELFENRISYWEKVKQEIERL
jgi:hypothetical protein